MDVKGKKIVLFGGTSGIGLAAARQLAALGGKVTAISRDPGKAGDPGPGITLKQGDVRDRDAFRVESGRAHVLRGVGLGLVGVEGHAKPDSPQDR